MNCEITCLNVSLLEEEERFRCWMERMPEFRRRKVLSLHNADSQRLSLGVGILLFRALEKRGVDGKNVLIAEETMGRPYLLNHTDIYFSLSHAGEWALCALSNQRVGCDIERLGRGDPRLARRCFHPQEQEWLSRMNTREAWDRAFTRIWTRKESYLKGTGEGLSGGMRDFSTVNEKMNAAFWDSDQIPGYICACYLGQCPNDVQPSFEILSLTGAKNATL